MSIEVMTEALMMIQSKEVLDQERRIRESNRRIKTGFLSQKLMLMP